MKETKTLAMTYAQKDITGQTDLYLVILSANTYVFEGKNVSLTNYFFQCEVENARKYSKMSLLRPPNI